jgi:glycosyltransferase
MKTISIITTTLNASDTVGQCINSIKQQSVAAEHIVIDAGSTDNTAAMLERQAAGLNILTVPGLGIYEALNRGLALCRGEIIGILNADDYYPSPDILSRVLREFDNPAVDACYGDLVYVRREDTGKIARSWRAGAYDPRNFYHGWMPPHPTFFVRRTVYERYGGFNTDLGTAADYELMLRFLLKHQVHAVYIPEVLVHMRSGGVSNRSLLNRIRANRMDRQAWRVNELQPRPWTLFLKPLRKLRQWIFK